MMKPSPTLTPIKVCVLISGGGSNLQALIDASPPSPPLLASKQSTIAERSHPAATPWCLTHVVSNRADAFGLTRAKRAGISTTICAWDRAKTTRDHYDAKLAAVVNASDCDLVVMAGFLHIVAPIFLAKMKCPVINLHPALPDSYIGLHAIERGFADWQAEQSGGQTKAHGVMVHHVSADLDRGAVITTQTITPDTGDTLTTFSEKMHAAERVALVRAVTQVAESLKTECFKTESLKVEFSKTKSLKVEFFKTKSLKTESLKTESLKTEPIQTEPRISGNSRAQTMAPPD